MNEFVIIVESAADFRTASTIANRVLIEQIDWLEEVIPHVLQWSGLEAGTEFSAWSDLKSIERAMKQRGVHLSRYLGKPEQTLKADGATALKFLRMVEQLKKEADRNIKAVILIRDLDNQSERRQGLEQARSAHSSLITVLGTANGKREAWILNGFDCLNETEKSRLAKLCRELDFDPRIEAHRLRATTSDEPERLRNVKIVLTLLTNDDHKREAQCWESTALAVLRERGVHTGLIRYMNEVETHLVPILQQG